MFKDGVGKSPLEFDNKAYILQETVNFEVTSPLYRTPRYFKIRTRIKLVDKDVFLEDMKKRRAERGFEYLLR